MRRAAGLKWAAGGVGLVCACANTIAACAAAMPTPAMAVGKPMGNTGPGARLRAWFPVDGVGGASVMAGGIKLRM